MNFEIMVATDQPIYYMFSRGRLVGTLCIFCWLNNIKHNII